MHAGISGKSSELRPRNYMRNAAFNAALDIRERFFNCGLSVGLDCLAVGLLQQFPEQVRLETSIGERVMGKLLTL